MRMQSHLFQFFALTLSPPCHCMFLRLRLNEHSSVRARVHVCVLERKNELINIIINLDLCLLCCLVATDILAWNGTRRATLIFYYIVGMCDETLH